MPVNLLGHMTYTKFCWCKSREEDGQVPAGKEGQDLAHVTATEIYPILPLNWLPGQPFPTPIFPKLFLALVFLALFLGKVFLALADTYMVLECTQSMQQWYNICAITRSLGQQISRAAHSSLNSKTLPQWFPLVSLYIKTGQSQYQNSISKLVPLVSLYISVAATHQPGKHISLPFKGWGEGEWQQYDPQPHTAAGTDVGFLLPLPVLASGVCGSIRPPQASGTVFKSFRSPSLFWSKPGSDVLFLFTVQEACAILQRHLRGLPYTPEAGTGRGK